MAIYFQAGTVNAGADTKVELKKVKHQRISWIGFFVETSEWTFEVGSGILDRINPETGTKLTVLTRLVLPLDKKVDSDLVFTLSNTGASNSRFLLLVSTERAVLALPSDLRGGGAL